ncbi:MAG: hypothetical protein WBQ16_07330 [Nitrososphaeraceae archaeon]
MYKKYTAVISLALVALAMLGATIGSGLNTAYGNGELGKGSPKKEEFQISVRNIGHKDLIASLAIDGLEKKQNIDGNPSYIDAPTIQVVRFRFDRHEDASTPGVLPIKLGDEYTTCVALKKDKGTGTCLRSSIDSITTPQTKNLYVDFIPDSKD